MASYTKTKDGKWRVSYSFHDWTGEYKRTSKRGFSTKKDAKDWYEDFALNKAKNLSMSFSAFVDYYLEDMAHRLKENTIDTKKTIIATKILPYFKNKAICDISPVDIRKWQACMLDQKLKPTYLKTIYNQLSAIFNYAVRFYDLKYNPCAKAGTIGSARADEKHYWTVSEFNTFAEALHQNTEAYVGFKLLFWTGMRIGELLALNYKDFDFNEKVVSISKSYQRINGKDVISTPKTRRSKRVIGVPNFLVEDLKDYFSRLYDLQTRERIFPYTKYFFEHKLTRYAKKAGVKKIRIHDLRHSHASLLINQNLPIKAISDRLGHERIETTLNIYSHLYQTTQKEIVRKLEALEKENLDSVK